MVLNKDFKYLIDGYVENEARDIFDKNYLIIDLPVLNKQHELITLVHRKNYFSKDELEQEKNSLKNIPVVIMAGGKGSRIDPFTRILPKPLIPLGNEPIIKVIMDEFKKFGLEDFHISINDKGQMIKGYFHDHALPYGIQFIEEDKPLGTAGALMYVREKFNGTMFVSNCDILIHADYKAIYNYHVEGDYDLTLVASMRHYEIPYGVCEISDNGELDCIQEKPEYDFLVNTGLYLLESSVLKLIPNNEFYDMTDLINKLKKVGKKVGVFPVSEKSWSDVGQWEEYSNTLTKLF